MKKSCLFCVFAVALSLYFLISVSAVFAGDKTIIEEWSSIKTPQPPPLSSIVTADPSSTALLMLDFNKQTCNIERRPRCIASLPDVGKLLETARANKLAVIHSISPGAAPADIAAVVAPRDGEPVVQSGPDKFLGTDLEKILNEKKIKTVVVVGTAAHGAVLYTASGAALRGLDVIVPVDGMSAEDLFAEHYVAWHLKNAPRIGAKTVLTKISAISFVR
ncbi:MAG: isochorismatase hydrolase [Nitrospirae bacterium]|nr:MAG: isochorismatase hydrolase [Nitrospirota bacterium]